MTKLFSVIALLAMTTMASAQYADMPLHADVMKNGEKVGTATKSGNIITLRGPDGELVGTVELQADGGRIVRDPEGKLTGTVTKDGDQLTFHKAE